MALYPGATWRNSPNHAGPLTRSIGVILHVEAGTEAGTCQVFSEASYQASAHFGIAKDGSIDQFVDTANVAWAQAAGNSSYFSIETEGYPTEPLTEAQCQSFAKLYAWLKSQPNAAFGFTLAEAPGQPGLGWHGMGGAAWGGHTGCPGDLRKAQRQHILDLAQPKVVLPMYNPPFAIAGKVVASLNAPGGGAWVLTDGGAIYAFGCPDHDAPNRHDYWGGRTAAQLLANGNGYTVVASDGSQYAYPA